VRLRDGRWSIGDGDRDRSRVFFANPFGPGCYYQPRLKTPLVHSPATKRGGGLSLIISPAWT
jgi:hypothetical protein